MFSNEENKPNGIPYCRNCFSYTKEECICDRIIGYDAQTGVPIVDLTDDEENYLSKKDGDMK